MFNYLKVFLSPPFSYQLHPSPSNIHRNWILSNTLSPTVHKLLSVVSALLVHDVLLTWVTVIRHLSLVTMSLFILI